MRFSPVDRKKLCELLSPISKDKVFKKFLKYTDILNNLNVDVIYDRFYKCLENMDDPIMMAIYDQLQQYTDQTNVFEDFETDILKETIQAILSEEQNGAEFN